MTTEEQLKNIGLNKNEIRVYWYLLSQGVCTPPQISQGTHIARTHCYNLLRSLQDKQLVREQQKGKRKAYIAQNPKALLASLDRKKQALEEILPDLEALYTTQKNKPKIRFFEGWEQVKEIYYETLSTKEIYSIGSTKHLSEIDIDFFQKYAKLVRQKEIIVHDIISFSSVEKTFQNTKDILKGYYEAQVIPKEFSNFQTDILIWEDNIALITLEEPIFGTVLTNKLFAETFCIIFKVMKEKL